VQEIEVHFCKTTVIWNWRCQAN